jgi:hypothetical protein
MSPTDSVPEVRINPAGISTDMPPCGRVHRPSLPISAARGCGVVQISSSVRYRVLPKICSSPIAALPAGRTTSRGERSSVTATLTRGLPVQSIRAWTICAPAATGMISSSPGPIVPFLLPSTSMR